MRIDKLVLFASGGVNTINYTVMNMLVIQRKLYVIKPFGEAPFERSLRLSPKICLSLPLSLIIK